MGVLVILSEVQMEPPAEKLECQHIAIRFFSPSPKWLNGKKIFFTKIITNAAPEIAISNPICKDILLK